MFLQAEKALILCKSLVVPHIYIRPDVDKLLVPKLRDIIKRHQGVLVDDAEAATHVVYTLPQNPPSQEGEWTWDYFWLLIILNVLLYSFFSVHLFILFCMLWFTLCSFHCFIYTLLYVMIYTLFSSLLYTLLCYDLHFAYFIALDSLVCCNLYFVHFIALYALVCYNLYFVQIIAFLMLWYSLWFSFPTSVSYSFVCYGNYKEKMYLKM